MFCLKWQKMPWCIPRHCLNTIFRNLSSNMHSLQYAQNTLGLSQNMLASLPFLRIFIGYQSITVQYSRLQHWCTSFYIEAILNILAVLSHFATVTRHEQPNSFFMFIILLLQSFPTRNNLVLAPLLMLLLYGMICKVMSDTLLP